MLAPDLGNKRVEPLLELRWNQIFSIGGAVNDMNVVIRVGVTHVGVGPSEARHHTIAR